MGKMKELVMSNEEIQEQVDDFLKKMKKNLSDAYMDSIVYGQGVAEIPNLSKGFCSDVNKIYSSILGKYINADTGEVIND